VLNESTGRSRITHDTGGVPMAHCGDKLGPLCPAFVLNESTGRSRITHDTGGVPMAHCGDKLGLLCPAFSR